MHRKQPSEGCRNVEILCPIIAEFIVQCPDDAINQALLSLGCLTAAERREAAGQGMFEKLCKRAMRLLWIDWRERIEAGVSEFIQIALYSERYKVFV